MDLEAYFNYLKEFAVDHKSIGHTDEAPRFFRVDISELDNAKRSKIHYPAVAALNPAFGTTAEISTNVRIQYNGALVLLDKVQDRGDAEDRATKENALLQTAIDFITKFINDRRKYDEANEAYILPGLNLSSFNLDLVPNEYTSVCGVMLSFNWNVPLKQFDESNWNNQTRYTV